VAQRTDAGGHVNDDKLGFMMILGALALVVACLAYEAAHADDAKNACQARGGVYHCTSSTAVGFNTGKGGGVTVTPIEQCDCFTQDGRVLLEGR
jgi:hypothetical protein